jgi:uncharacterized protein
MMADEDLGKLIFYASSGGDEAGLAELLADPQAEAVLSWSDSGRGWTSLHVAAEMRHAEVIRALLRAGAPLEARDRQGWTPLFVAVDADIDASLQENEPLDLTCTKLLLAAGAAPEAVAPDGCTPVQIAERYGCTEAVRTLQKRPPTKR